MEFRVKPHSLRPGGHMVEVWLDGTFVAGIYPHVGKDVKGRTLPAVSVVSKYFENYCYYTDDYNPAKIVLTLDVPSGDVVPLRPDKTT